MKYNDLEQEYEYKLYRTVKDILHPSISKKNISNYKIILSENIMPVRVSYPKKISEIEKVIIYIHGVELTTNLTTKYSNISDKFALELNSLVITLDYTEYKNENILKLFDKLYNDFKYIYFELLKNNIQNDYITLIGDSVGGSCILSFNEKMPKDQITINNQILFYPVVSNKYFNQTTTDSQIMTAYNRNIILNLEKYFQKRIDKKDYNNSKIFIMNKKNPSTFTKTLFICGNMDPFIEDIRKLDELFMDNSNIAEIPFAQHSFLNNCDNEIVCDYLNKIKLFLNK